VIDDLVDDPCSSSAYRQRRGDYPHDERHFVSDYYSEVYESKQKLSNWNLKVMPRFHNGEISPEFQAGIFLVA